MRLVRTTLGFVPAVGYWVNPSLAIREMPSGLSPWLKNTIRPRLLAAALAVAAGAVAVTAVTIALYLQPSLDITVGPRGDTLASVLPGGVSWQDGIRPGQQVMSLAFGPTADQWHLDAVDAQGGGHGASSEGQATAIRATLPYGIAAGIAALLSLAAFARRSRIAGALALLSILLAQPALRVAGAAEGATAVIAGTPLVAAVWLTARTPRRRMLVALLAVSAVTAFWLVAKFWVVETFDLADAVLVALGIGLIGLALVTSAPWRTWFTATVRLDPSLAIDLGALALVVGGAIVAMTTMSAPPLAAAGAGVVVLAVYPRIRRRLGAMLEEMVLGDARQHASITATEEERARLAHEIHDGPLQELAAVIGRLDDEPQMTREANVLRDVAAELRGVTTALRPPVLDDLGLAAAVAFIVDQARLQVAEGLTIACEVDDRGGLGRAVRPPQEVELAFFRIVQEAIGNAVRHAGAARISVVGSVEAAKVHLEVLDDGRGIDEEAVREARRDGHSGLVSMRQRAAAIGADYTAGPRPGGGTVVSVDWSAS